MGCACKKKVEKIVQYDRKIAKENGEIINEKVTEVIEYLSFWDSTKNILKFIGMLLIGILALCLIIPFIFIWFFVHAFKRVVLKKESKINSPFFEYDKIKQKVKNHNNKIKEIIDSKKNIDTDKTIII